MIYQKSVWETINDLFELEGIDYAIRCKGLPHTSDGYFEELVSDYYGLAKAIENYVTAKTDEENN